MERKNKTSIIGLFLVIISLLSPLSYALSFETIPAHSGTEMIPVSFNISLNTYNGTTSFSVSPKGTVSKINDSQASYYWMPSSTDSGNYTLTFSATDDSSTISEVSSLQILNSNVPPVITEIYAGSQNVPQVTISLGTNKAATCKYSMSSTTYSQMQYTFASLNSEKTQHEGKTPALSQGAHTLYVLCNDAEGNYMTSPHALPLSINLRPSISISLEPDSPLREGTIAVSITASEPLIAAPELRYSFDDDVTQKTVALIGSGSSWQGYLVIKDNDNERIGSFTYRGFDLSNTEGSEITSGKLFLIDTQEPPAISSVSLENLEEKIKIQWEEPDTDNIKSYKIFRKSQTGNVDEVDFYKSTDKLYYYDEDVEYSVAYYYRVSAVDMAGNEGQLSKEVFITRLPADDDDDEKEIIKPSPTDEKLDSRLQYILSDKIAELDKTELNIAKAEETLSRLLGSDNIETLETLGLLAKIDENKNAVSGLKDTLESFRQESLSQSEFNSGVQELLDEADALWKTTPLEVKIIDSSSYQEFTNDEKTRAIVADYLKKYYPDLNVKGLDEQISNSLVLQDKLSIDVKLIKGEVKYPDETKPFVIVKKTIRAEGIDGKTVIFENIPAGAMPIEEVKFTKQPFFNEETAFWNSGKVSGETISYYIESDLNIAELKSVKTVVFLEQPLIDEQRAMQEEIEDNSITGGVTGKADGEGNFLLVLIVAGVMVVCGLFAYYVFYSEEEGNNKSAGNIEKKSFDVGKFLFKKKTDSIIPDSHRIINIEKPENDIHSRMDSYDIQSISNVKHQAVSDTSVQTSLDDSPIFKDERKPAPSRLRRAEFDELASVHETLMKVKAKATVNDTDELDELRNETYRIKSLCEEIEEQSIIEFTNKTKASLEKSLLYIAKHIPPSGQREKHSSYNETATKNPKDEKKRDSEPTIEAQAISIPEEPKQLALTHHTEIETRELQSMKIPGTIRLHSTNIAAEGKEFVFANGNAASTIQALKESIAAMHNDEFCRHVNAGKNDFATWIGEIFGEYELAAKVREAMSKEEIVRLL